MNKKNMWTANMNKRKDITMASVDIMITNKYYF